MPKINPYFSELKSSYIFSIIEEKVAATSDKDKIINLGIGDIALPLAPSIAQALCQATEEMTTDQGKKGYGPSEGYPFLRQIICRNEYEKWGFTPEEIFISDGTNTDTANIQELFSYEARIVVPEPTYPVYYATNVLAGRKKQIKILPCTEENQFLPFPPSETYDLIYLCSPSNPMGVAMDRTLLKRWVNYALEHEAIIVLDNAYAAFATSPSIPESIYEIEGASKVAIECRSFSKSAGFTGLRCAYCVVPKNLSHNLHALWKRRQAIKFNGVAYPIQRAAEAVFSEEGKKQVSAQVSTYLESAKILSEVLTKTKQKFFGGIDAPYIWWKTPNGMKSWEFFDHLLEHCQIIGIPGSGFGDYGEGYFRLSTFSQPKTARIAAERLLCAL
jgi:LL-diaminopimelate aminotransferase